MILKKNKLKMFNQYLIEEYTTSLFIEKLAQVETIRKTDGTFIQIAIRPQISGDIFTEENYSSKLIGAGRAIALGERNFFINTLLDDLRIKRVEINKEEFNPQHLNLLVGSNFTNILIPLNLENYLWNNSAWSGYFTFNNLGEEFFNGKHKSFWIPNNLAEIKLTNILIILPEFSLNWKKQIFRDRFSGKENILDIKIGKVIGGEVDVMIRSVNKIEYNPQNIIIIKLI